MELELYYPVNPHHVNRAWGVEDSLYGNYGFARHNGVDLALVTGQLIRAPFDCRVIKVGNQPAGSGNYICLLSKNEYTFEDGMTCHVEITFMHLQAAIAREGNELSVGDMVAFGDNTGQSTGSHTHMAPKRVTMVGGGGAYIEADHNDAADTFDPEVYWIGVYAEDAGPDDHVALEALRRSVERAKAMIEDLKAMIAERMGGGDK